MQSGKERRKRRKDKKRTRLWILEYNNFLLHQMEKIYKEGFLNMFKISQGISGVKDGSGSTVQVRRYHDESPAKNLNDK